jgi:hypothetical protein
METRAVNSAGSEVAWKRYLKPAGCNKRAAQSTLSSRVHYTVVSEGLTDEWLVGMVMNEQQSA